MKLKKPRKSWAVTWFITAVLIILAFLPIPSQHPIRYIERDTGEVKTEKVYGEQWLNWLYHNPVGRVGLWTVAKRKFLSSVYGEMMDRPSSASKVAPFIKEYGVDITIAEKQQFTSFNDFFTRRLKPSARPIAVDSQAVASPADGKILAYENIRNADFYIKGVRFSVASFLMDPDLAKKYEDGSMIVFRLAPPDYHRYHFPVSGTTGKTNIKIGGSYYSVNPLALREKAEIFWLNKREYGIIKSPVFGDVIMVEVGATMVGSMIQTYTGTHVQKGQEKGYFKFGGSTVVLLFEKERITVDPDLLANTSKGLETTVKMGEQIAVKSK